MEKLKALFAQAVKFGLVGVLNTLVDYLSYSLLLFLPFFARNYVLAQVIGYSLVLCNSLFFNKRWTFKQREAMSRRQLLLFLLVNLLALAFSTGILVLTQEMLHLNPYIGKLISTAGSLCVNFLGNKLLVFGGKRE